MASITRNNTTTKTSFLTLPRQLRQSTLFKRHDDSELYEATQQVKERFLTWEDLSDRHGERIKLWAATLMQVHGQIISDVNYVEGKWQERQDALMEETITEYEKVARKRRARFLRYRIIYRR
jgi:hypothetical protein